MMLNVGYQRAGRSGFPVQQFPHWSEKSKSSESACAFHGQLGQKCVAHANGSLTWSQQRQTMCEYLEKNLACTSSMSSSSSAFSVDSMATEEEEKSTEKR